MGCTTYYRISDQATGRAYYTTDYDLTDSGAVVFEDAKSLSKVTLQSSEVSKVSRTASRSAEKNKPSSGPIHRPFVKNWNDPNVRKPV